MANKPEKSAAPIVLIEGVWGSGKSTLARELVRLGYVWIREPSHLGHVVGGSFKRQSRWYARAHRQNLRRAFAISRAGQAVCVERTALATVAFLRTYVPGMRRMASVVLREFLHDLTRAPQRPFIVQPPIRDLAGVSRRMQSVSHLRGLADSARMRKLHGELSALARILLSRGLVVRRTRSQVLRGPLCNSDGRGKRPL